MHTYSMYPQLRGMSRCRDIETPAAGAMRRTTVRPSPAAAAATCVTAARPPPRISPRRHTAKTDAASDRRVLCAAAAALGTSTRTPRPLRRPHRRDPALAKTCDPGSHATAVTAARERRAQLSPTFRSVQPPGRQGWEGGREKKKGKEGNRKERTRANGGGCSAPQWMRRPATAASSQPSLWSGLLRWRAFQPRTG